LDRFNIEFMELDIQDTSKKENDNSKDSAEKKKKNGKEEILNPSPSIERRYTISLSEIPKQSLASKEAKKREKEEEKQKKIEEKRKKEEEKKKKRRR